MFKKDGRKSHVIYSRKGKNARNEYIDVHYPIRAGGESKIRSRTAE